MHDIQQLAALAALLAACVGTAPSATEDSASSSSTVDSAGTDELSLDLPPPRVDLELVVDGQVFIGLGLTGEVDIPRGYDCAGGVYLPLSSGGDVYTYASVAFADRNPGTESRMVDPGAELGWSRTGDGATDVWIGTYRLATWTDDEVVIELDAGTRCELPDRTRCFPATGTLTVTGDRFGTRTAPRDEAFYNGMRDVATGQRLCYAR